MKAKRLFSRRATGKGFAFAAILFGAILAAAGWLVLISQPEATKLGAASASAQRQATGQPQLVGVRPLSSFDGAMCEWLPASYSPAPHPAVDESMPRNEQVDRAPLRQIRDTYPTYSAIALDLESNEVYLQDENLFGIKVFNRTDNTPPSASFTEPKRSIGGLLTKLEFNCGIYVDPKTGDIYSVANDTVDTMVVFPRDAQGNLLPKRQLSTPHGTFGIAVNEQTEELYLTVQHEHSVVVYNKMAKDDDKPLRTIQGGKTGLADPHGVALDVKNGLMFVSNHGNYNEKQAIGSGKFFPPSITVYPIKAEGNVAPLRTIVGPKTGLNWPAAMSYDENTQELYVANDVGDSVVIFGANDSGDVAPHRQIKGPQTGIKNPTGTFLDMKNKELWVVNMGNHSTTVYPMTASGNVAPLRTIRSAPQGKLALAIGNPGAVAYDSKREQVLVPNCVAHPQISIFPRLGQENTKPARLLAGQKTLLARTMHDIRYDEQNDEILVTNPFAQAIMTFRGGADGEEAPVRVLQGAKTLMTGPSYSGVDRAEVDGVNNEIIVPGRDQILVFSRMANGDVAPIRVIKGPDTKLNGASAIAVDAVHNLLVVGGSVPGQGGGSGAIFVFDRTADGNAKPKGVIAGPKTEIIRINQLQVYAPKGWIVAAQPGSANEQEPEGIFVGIWSVNDNGNVAPRWKVGGGPNGEKSVMKKPRGVAFDAQHKELLVADMRLNSILTYYFPEMF